MSTIAGSCLILVSFTVVGGYILESIRNDYCELFLNASKINEKTCQYKNNFIITNEYELELVRADLSLKWSRENSFGVNPVAVANEMRSVFLVNISGIRSVFDPRLRPSSFYLNKLNLEDVDTFYINAEHFVIEEQYVHCEEGPKYLWIEFKQSVNWGPLNDYIAASTNRIRILSINGIQVIDSGLCLNFQFFSLQDQQKSVDKKALSSDKNVKNKCLENYRRLKYIFFEGPYETVESTTAFTCQALKNCIFTIETNGQRCPRHCKCSFKYSFQFRCSDRNLTEIPPLSIPLDGDIDLKFVGNLLTQLPNNTLPGYLDVVSLDVSYNKITSIGIHQLPWRLKSIDISNNLIKTVDSRVANYLFRIKSIRQEGIKWNVNCDEKHLIKLLYKLSSSQYIFLKQLNERCPHKCKCCFDRATKNFLIKCTRRETYPELPYKIPNKVSLLLANCSIRELPENLQSLLITQNITNLDLRNNSLKSLHGEVVNFYNNHSETSIKLSRNPWTCYCKDKSFLQFLKSRDPLEYTIAMDRCNLFECPEGCFCCLESSESSAVTVDCRGQQLTQFPHLPDSVTTLDLRDNEIKEINMQSQAFISDKILFKSLKVFLSGNPWTCWCAENDFFAFAKHISQSIPDFAKIECSNLGKRLALVEESEICPEYYIYPLLLFIFSLIIITTLNAIVYIKQPILMWFYEHEICMSMAVRMDLERIKKFDAFLCFTHKDEYLVDDFVERLENGQRKFRLCFYLRDWNVGASIPECIIQSVKDSRRIIILMTKNFLESTWGKLEFRLALHATSKDRCKRLIVILYPDVENFDDLDSELKAYMVLNTYLRRDSLNFWNKLIYSMPHVT